MEVEKTSLDYELSRESFLFHPGKKKIFIRKHWKMSLQESDESLFFKKESSVVLLCIWKITCELQISCCDMKLSLRVLNSKLRFSTRKLQSRFLLSCKISKISQAVLTKVCLYVKGKILIWRYTIVHGKKAI